MTSIFEAEILLEEDTEKLEEMLQGCIETHKSCRDKKENAHETIKTLTGERDGFVRSNQWGKAEEKNQELKTWTEILKIQESVLQITAHQIEKLVAEIRSRR